MPPKPKSGRDDAAPLDGARVMVVDDHAFTMRLVKDVLYASGAASVQTATNGGEAVAMLRRCQPHLVITDWRMPGLDGLAFTRIVRQAAVEPDPRVPDPQTPIVLLSAHASTRAVEAARRVGVNEVVVKPFTIATLMQRIHAAMTQPRPFVVSNAYVGPDRRRAPGGPVGRRWSDAGMDTRFAEAAAGMETSAPALPEGEGDAVEQPRRATGSH
jgi:CheY-like chemotaxis protein